MARYNSREVRFMRTLAFAVPLIFRLWEEEEMFAIDLANNWRHEVPAETPTNTVTVEVTMSKQLQMYRSRLSIVPHLSGLRCALFRVVVFACVRVCVCAYVCCCVVVANTSFSPPSTTIPFSAQLPSARVLSAMERVLDSVSVMVAVHWLCDIARRIPRLPF